MSPGRYPGWLARRGPTQTHRHITAVGSDETECPKPPGLRPWLAARAVVQAQPLPAFTTSGMPKARKGSMGQRPAFLHPAFEIKRLLAGPGSACSMERLGIAAERGVHPPTKDRVHDCLRRRGPVFRMTIRGAVQIHVPLVARLLDWKQRAIFRAFEDGSGLQVRAEIGRASCRERV